MGSPLGWGSAKAACTGIWYTVTLICSIALGYEQGASPDVAGRRPSGGQKGRWQRMLCCSTAAVGSCQVSALCLGPCHAGSDAVGALLSLALQPGGPHCLRVVAYEALLLHPALLRALCASEGVSEEALEQSEVDSADSAAMLEQVGTGRCEALEHAIAKVVLFLGECCLPISKL